MQNHEGSYRGRFSLYRQRYGIKNAKPELVDKDVNCFCVIDKNTVFYQKNYKKIYRSDMKNQEKVAPDASFMAVSEDKKYFMWISESDGDLFVQDTKLADDKIKIASNVQSIDSYTPNFEYIAIIDQDNTYTIISNFEDKEEICSGNESVFTHVVDHELEVVYIESDVEGTQMSISEILEDPYAETDANMKEPNIEDYQRTVQKDSFWGTRTSVETDDAYYDEMEKYQEKLERDSIRLEVANSLNVTSSKICSYSTKTKKTKEIYEGLVLEQQNSQSAVFLTLFDITKAGTISLDALMELGDWEMSEKMSDILRQGMTFNLLYQDVIMPLDIDATKYYSSVLDVETSPNEKLFYFTLNNIDDDNATLFQTDTQGKVNVVNEEVYEIEAVAEDGVIYSTDYDDGEVTLYYNDEKVDSEAVNRGCTILSDGSLLYKTDVDDSKRYTVGTLYIYKNGKKKKISDDVAEIVEFDDGKIVYLYDYNYTKNEGDLAIFNGRKNIKIDTDVTDLINVRKA